MSTPFVIEVVYADKNIAYAGRDNFLLTPTPEFVFPSGEDAMSRANLLNDIAEAESGSSKPSFKNFIMEINVKPVELIVHDYGTVTLTPEKQASLFGGAR